MNIHFLSNTLKSIVVSVLFISIYQNGYSQKTVNTDSLINAISNQSIVSNPNEMGITLLKSSNYTDATNFYSAEISKNEGNAEAYFNRGISQWQTNEPSKACQDWSAVLALGDTATFKLLDANCHGTMVIDGDTLHKEQYHQMFAVAKPNAKTSSANSNAMLVVDQMPEYKGGDAAMLKYLTQNIKYPADALSKGISGTVIVNIIISTKGNVMFPYVKKGIGGGCDEEALRVIRNMPAWNCGKQAGKPVLVRYNIPVKFSIK